MGVKKYNTLIIDNSPAYTGALKAILSATKLLSEDVHVSFALPSQSIVKKLKDEGYNVYYVPFIEINKSWKLLLYVPLLILNTFRVLRIVKSQNIQILHVNDLYNMIGSLVKVLKPNIKLIYHVRLLPSSYASVLYGIWCKIILNTADHVICVSDVVCKALPNSPKKQTIYDALPKPKLKGVSKSLPFTFLYVGNYIPGKGHDYAIDAYSIVKNELIEVQLVFIGGDMGRSKNKAYKNQLIQKVKQHKLQNNIEFRDFCEDINEFYQCAQATLNFSESESFSLVCLESLLNGTPVIATRCGGPEEIIDHRINGLLVENKNIHDMAKAMVTFYKNEELRKAITMNIIDSTNKFSTDQLNRKLIKVYTGE